MGLSAFLKRLNEKNQPAQLQKQAKQAVKLYFACAQSPKKQQDFKNKDKTPYSINFSPNIYRKSTKKGQKTKGIIKSTLGLPLCFSLYLHQEFLCEVVYSYFINTEE